MPDRNADRAVVDAEASHGFTPQARGAMRTATSRFTSVPLLALAPITAAVPIGNLRSLWDVVVLVLALSLRPSTPSSRRLRIVLVTVGPLLVASYAIAQHVAGLPVPAGLLASVGWLAALASMRYIVHVWQELGEGAALIALAAFAVGSLSYSLVSGAGSGIAEDWKYGVGQSVVLLVAASGFARRSLGRLTFIALILAITSVAFAARNLAGTIIAALIVAGLGWAPAHLLFRRRVALALLGIVVVLALPAVLGSDLFAPTIERFQFGARFNDNLILAGRVEPPAELGAVLASPIWGIGLNGPLSTAIEQNALTIAPQLGYKVNSAMVDWWFQGGTVYTHSMIAAGWLGGGIVVGLFAIALAILAVSVAITIIVRPYRADLAFLITFLQVQLVWNLLASPISYGVLETAGLSVGLGVLWLWGLSERPNLPVGDGRLSRRVPRRIIEGAWP